MSDSESTPLQKRKKSDEGARYNIPSRYITAIMGHTGLAVAYALRVNLSVALVAMIAPSIGKTSLNISSSGNWSLTNSTISNSKKYRTFEWDSTTSGLIKGAFFWGYLLTQVPGGILTKRFGPKLVFGIGVLWTALLTLLSEWTANVHWGALLALRFTEGLGEAVTYPALHQLLSNWTPQSERSVMTTVAHSGNSVGTILIYPIAGALTKDLGWPSVFYFTGVLGIVWCLPWFYLVYDSPSQHPRISSKERTFLEQEVRVHDTGTQKQVRTPWKEIFLSPHVWAICICHFCNNWVLYLMITDLPNYLKNVLHVDEKTGGILSAVPFAACFLLQMLASFVADYLMSKRKWSTINTRRLFSCLGFFIPAASLISIGYTNSQWLAVVLVTTTIGFLGFNVSAFMCNHMDISPQFSGILMSITNSFGTVAGCVVPVAVGSMTKTNNNVDSWRTVFFVTASIAATGALAFLFLGSGEVQPWNNVTDSHHVEMTKIDQERSEKTV